MTIEYLSVTDVSKRLGISTAAVSASAPAQRRQSAFVINRFNWFPPVARNKAVL